MAKVRVYELAKELGVDSRALMTRLAEIGEFVRSASGTIEPDIVRKLREEYSAGGGLRAPASGLSVAPMRTQPRVSARAQDRAAGASTGRRGNPFVVRSKTRPFVEGTAPRRRLADRAREDAERVFGVDAVRETDRIVANGRVRYTDGYGLPWQRLLIEHETYLEFLRVGLDAHDADLAYECLIAGLRPAEMMTHLGDKTVLEWLRAGHSAGMVAGTLEQCRLDPKSRHLVVEQETTRGSTA
ncbi:translation initiation factor IF-2 N-terminal domain-containing protein [Cellulomonas soli]|uniref:Translation initiation factor IF-2 N-terminal domain-containing protein n=1 Tax=Cellulomonas soli TaxID=931535 RepID=A0A512PI63_9CELL|nr:translation initiation factor IF-2 N-terminal domain-containing protein [Cellulomonas soli]NYI58735.1 hypothetical protein [Cellulomonas soli]GEP70885.1 hypothetical protein CSO01_36000 [Cellulomonas soli]